ncbi:MAG: zonular occludens toxin domain-containing protein [Rhodocyclaceae bacterium]
MIELITGLPGGGKTLYALARVKAWAERERRPVFYSGIAINAEKLPDWQEIKAEEWHLTPPGSIVLIDECQRVFRPRGNGSAVPDYVAKLETHRHQGHDLVMITQHPMLAEQNLRRLVGRHFHVMRNFGFKKATVHEFEGVRQDPDKNRRGSQRHEWFYPKEVFAWYKSAELHTHKAKLPVRVFLIPICIVLAGGCGWYGVRFLLHMGDAAKTLVPGASSAAQSAPVAASVAQPLARTASNGYDYIAARTPRVPGLPQTAPVYDQVTQPVTAPYPAACVRMRKTCRCYTQQGTVLATNDDVCGQIVDRGYFVDWGQDRAIDKPPAEPARVAVAPVERSGDGAASGQDWLIAGPGRYDRGLPGQGNNGLALQTK